MAHVEDFLENSETIMNIRITDKVWYLLVERKELVQYRRRYHMELERTVCLTLSSCKLKENLHLTVRVS